MKIFLTASLMMTATVSAANTLSFYDQERLAHEPVYFSGAISDALASGAREDVNTLLDALEGEPAQANALGDWSCRSIQFGGDVTLTTTVDYTCTVSENSEGLAIEMTTGEQRFSGTLTDRNGTLLYSGVGFTGDAPTQTYDDFAELLAPVEFDTQTYPQVGILERMSDNRARLMMPAPVTGGDYSIVYLTR